MTALDLIWRQPTLLMIAGALLAVGALHASVYPYQSLIAINEIGLSEPAFGLVLILASAVTVTASVLGGILSDQRMIRRQVAVATTVAGTLAVALMAVVPGPVTLIVCHGILFPIATSIYGQLFALTRLASLGAESQRDAIQSTVRAGMSLSFLCMLVFWTWSFGNGADVMSVYISAGAASLTLTLLIFWYWPRDGATHNYDIVGPICETGDFLAKDRHLALAEGDLLAVCSAGAYGFVMSSNYNTRGRAAEVMVDGDQAFEVRRRETLSELFAGESQLPPAP